MRTALSLKMLLRAPLRTLITLLLLIAVSFGLLSLVCEYAVIRREMKKAMSYYQGIAVLDTGVPNTTNLSSRRDEYNWVGLNSITGPPSLTEEQISAFFSLPQVTSYDQRYMAAGVSDQYQRISNFAMYSENYVYNSRFIIEASYEDYKFDDWNQDTIHIRFSDYQLLAGPKNITPKGNSFTIETYIHDGVNYTWGTGAGAGIDYIMANHPYGSDFLQTLVPGSRYLMIGRVGGTESSGFHFHLGDFDTMEECPSVWSLDGKPENYLETDDFAPVRELIEITNKDYRTYDIVYTNNLNSIPRFADQKMIVSEGRPLTDEDQGTFHCVVSLAFLKKNRLKIGDTISLDLGNKLLEQNSGIGAVAVIPERNSEIVKSVELEIVGAYTDTDSNYERNANLYYGYSPNTIFVHSSLLPIAIPQDHEIKPGEFSLVIGNAGEMESFLESSNSLAEELGIEILFYDGGWFQVSQNIKTSTQASLLTIIVFVMASIFVIWLVVYLFISRSQKQYAIMRALGTPRYKAYRALIVSIGAVAAVAIPVGGIVGISAVLQRVSSTLVDISNAVTEQYIPDTSIPVWAVIGSFIGQILVLTFFIMFALIRLDKTPTLILLQGNVKRLGRNRKKNKQNHGSLYDLEHEEQQEKYRLPLANEIDIDTYEIYKAATSKGKNKYVAIQHVCYYSVRNLRRTKWKTAITLLLAVLLPTALGLFTTTVHSYDKLSQSVVVKCYMNDIASDLVLELSESSLVRDFYYRKEMQTHINGQLAFVENMLITNDLDRTLRSSGVIEYTTQYTDGYQWNDKSQKEAWCLIGEGIAKQYGLSLGDELSLLGREYLQRMFMLYEPQEMDAMILKNKVSFAVGGIISSDNEVINMSMFAPVGPHIEDVYGDIIAIEQVEGILTNNDQADDLRNYVETLKTKSLRYSQHASYAMDTGKLDNTIRMRDLLQMLFPLLVAAITLLGSVVPVIILIQSSKEVALLRVLGTTKIRTRCILSLEQLSLCIIGFLISFVIQVLYNPIILLEIIGVWMVYSGIYVLFYFISVMITSIIITRRRPLELLQAKE